MMLHNLLDSVADSYMMTQRSNLTQNRVDVLHGRGSSGKLGGRKDEPTMMQEVKGDEDRKSCAELLDRSYLFNAFEKGNRTVTREFCSNPGGQGDTLQALATLSRHPGEW